MILTIDTQKKTIKVSGKASCQELVSELSKLLKDGLESYSMDVKPPAAIDWNYNSTAPINSLNNFTGTKNEGVIPPVFY